MSQGFARRNLNAASLRQTGGARSVLLRMAADDARAARIRQIKDDNPGVTWGSIAEAIGVKERSAVEWARTGGISYENAKRLAAHFHCDLDWLWRGEPPSTPDLMADLTGSSQLDEILGALKQLASQQKRLAAAVAAIGEEVVALRREMPRRRQSA